MPRVKIIADSTCDIGARLIQLHDIDIVPLYVTLKGKTYRDGVDISAEALLSLCAGTKETPKTSAASVADFCEAFQPYVDAGREIVFIGISEAMSAQLQTARIAAQEFPNASIYCVDSKNLSTGGGLLVLEAAERAEAGMPASQIAAEIEAMRARVNASFVVDTLTYLHKGGRCSGLTALGAAMLSIKPQITVVDGHMAPSEKYRGNIIRVVPRYIEKQLANIEAVDPRRAFITHSGYAEAELARVAELVRARGYFSEVHVTRAGCVITSHCGPNTLGILFINK